jgi:hypothetical protein
MIITLEILTVVVVIVAFGISAGFGQEEEPADRVVRQRTRDGDNRRSILHWTEELDSMMPERTQGDDNKLDRRAGVDEARRNHVFDGDIKRRAASQA